MSEEGAREWWPADWADEVMPPGRSSPDGFLIDVDGHYYLGYALDAEGVSEFQKRYFNRYLHSGDIVNFICCDPLGEIDVRINPDGSYTALSDVPARATHFWLAGNPDTLADSLADFVRQYLECASIEKACIETIALAWWSDELPHKLVVSYDIETGRGKPAFVAVSQAEARQ